MFLHVSTTFFFLNDPPTTEIYTLSLHDALPICPGPPGSRVQREQLREQQAHRPQAEDQQAVHAAPVEHLRSEEHTSELQSQSNIVCRLLLEKKKHNTHPHV